MARLEILKTYKIFIGGQFPRTESGRYYTVSDAKKKPLANMCLSSRKDFRNAVQAARKALEGWAERAAFNRSQIIYRLAEMLEGRKAQFVEELILQGASKAAALREVQQSIDRTVHYSGWCDKYMALFSSVNPVASSHFNFSIPEPMGVVAIISPERPSLLGLLSLVLPAICGGNTVVVLASEQYPLTAITLAEVFATSDMPGGVVNILTGKEEELYSHFASHMDVNALVYGKGNTAQLSKMKELCSLNLKRSFDYNPDWSKAEGQSPYFIMDLQEIKTTWHPIEKIGISGAKY
jgi:acyl-CoA reductase-like NAD-dependent aldehyde dehydrogenase